MPFNNTWQDSALLPPLLPARKLNRSDGNMAGTMMVKNMPLKVGHTLTVTGFPTEGAERFMMNIDYGADIAFHMSVWLNTTSVYKDLVVYNTKQGGSWKEEIHTGLFPFKQTGLFKFTVTLTRDEFLVILSDGSEVHFPNRLGASEYNDFSFEKGVRIRSFEIN
uniref:Galectin n=1 Tax=Gadus morhua TaxID=8049 RepID=A0A8C5B120_GADMO